MCSVSPKTAPVCVTLYKTIPAHFGSQMFPVAELTVTVRSVTVSIAEPDLVESAVETAMIVGVAAPVNAGGKLTAVPELTPEVAESVPADVGPTERFTVFVNAPMPVTIGVQAVV